MVLKKWKLLIFFLLSALAVIAGAMQAASEPEAVTVGLYLLNLGKFDVATGAFTADFYLSLKCEIECNPENFEFMNGRSASTDKILDNPDEKFYRIQANLNSPVDLKNFPFDKQQMQIILEDKKRSIEYLVYEPSDVESGIDDSIAFAGWKLLGWNSEVREHYYSIYNESYSQYVFSVDISRIVFNSFFKTFLPVMFMILILMFSFVMDTDKITTRLAVATSTLVASVMFHISISNQIPPVGYLTVADKFMVLTYLLILAAVVLNVSILELLERKKADVAEKLHRRTEYAVFIIYPLVYVLFFTLIYLF
jgi:hypothetical protein